MAKKIEELIEFQDKQELSNRLRKLPSSAHERILENIITQVCWHGPVDREWLSGEIKCQEIVERRAEKAVADFPIEDHFGSEIRVGDKWFTDQAGRVILEDNMDDYLLEVANLQICRAIE